MYIVNFLIYSSALLLLILLLYLVISFFPSLNTKIKFFDKKTPIYERATFYISSLVSVVSLIISLKTYDDAIEASASQNKINDSTRVSLEKVVSMIAKQTEALESSRNSLQSVVKLSDIQQKILDASLSISTQQLKTINAKNDEERKKASYAPKLEVSLNIDTLNYTEKDLVKVRGQNWFLINLDKSYLNKKISAEIGLINRGQISAKGTVLLLTPLLPNTIDIEKISGLNPINDHFSKALKIDVAEFYDYYSIDIPVAQTNSIFSPEYKFNIIPTANESSIKIDVTMTNGINRFFVVFIVLR